MNGTTEEEAEVLDACLLDACPGIGLARFPGQPSEFLSSSRSTTAIACDPMGVPAGAPAASALSGMLADTLDDYLAKNAAPGPVGPAFLASGRIRFLPEPEVEAAIGSEPVGWWHFYEAFPGVRGCVEFSRIGFDRRVAQAVLYLGLSFGGRNAGGEHLLIGRVGSSWRIEARSRIWLA